MASAWDAAQSGVTTVIVKGEAAQRAAAGERVFSESVLSAMSQLSGQRMHMAYHT